MLEEIRIKNLGVIPESVLSFTPGLNILTGETGAGKTMVLTALGLLLGKKAEPGIVRTGATTLTVEGCWNTQQLTVLEQILDTGAVIEDDNLYINRTVTNENKSRLVVGGKTTPLSVITGFKDNLIRIHGQADQIKLKTPAAQREALDRYIGSGYGELYNEYKTVYQDWKTTQKQLDQTKENQVALTREYDYLVNVLNDYETVKPVQGETETLQQEETLLKNFKPLTEKLSEAYDQLDKIILPPLYTVLDLLTTTTNYTPALIPTAEMVDTAVTLLNETRTEITSQLADIDETDLQKIDTIQERLYELQKLAKKYGNGDIETAIEFWEETQKRAEQINPETNNLDVLTEKVNQTLKKLTTLGDQLTKIRTQHAVLLEKAVNRELDDLAMSGTKLVVQVTPQNTPTLTGFDEVAFLIKTPGEKEGKLLTKTASGGELSRIMLALEITLADPESTPTYIFDEVDAGIGGQTATKIGEKLAKLSETAQVIAVTHLAQVAAFADNHMVVTKTTTDTEVTTKVSPVADSTRVVELARLLSGSDSDTAKAHAVELLSEAEQTKTW